MEWVSLYLSRLARSLSPRAMMSGIVKVLEPQ
jgi:hypothetical protein